VFFYLFVYIGNKINPFCDKKPKRGLNVYKNPNYRTLFFDFLQVSPDSDFRIDMGDLCNSHDVSMLNFNSELFSSECKITGEMNADV